MINILEWQTLAKRRRSAWLQMFNKIHYKLVAISMPLQCKWISSPSRTENSPACCIPASIADYLRLSFFPPVRDWNLLSKNPVRLQECSPEGLVIPQMYSCKPCTHAPVCTRASRPVTEEQEEQEQEVVDNVLVLSIYGNRTWPSLCNSCCEFARCQCIRTIDTNNLNTSPYGTRTWPSQCLQIA